MLAKWGKRIAGVLVLVLLVAGTIYAMLPQPVPVDVAIIDRGPLEVTIDEEGIARIRDVFKVSAPIAGRVERLPVQVGDTILQGTTTVATIYPTDPPFLDVRTRREIEAAVSAGRAAVDVAKAQVTSAYTKQSLAQASLARAQKLASNDTISASAFEKATADVAAATAELEQAKAALSLRESELNSTEARLIRPDQREGGDTSCCLIVRSPVDGTVLSVANESEQVVPAGAPLLEIGNPRDMEVVVHLLSSDAVSVTLGAAARLDGWGGGALAANVSRINPAAYTKVSALGIEEQRVDARLTLADPYDAWQRLGHEFRVMVHIVTWKGDSVLRVPLGALFRRGSNWTVYRVVDNRAVATPVTIGHRNGSVAEVIAGIAESDKVVLHPSDRVIDGVAITVRE